MIQRDKDEWCHLKSTNYGGSPIMRLCAPHKRTELCRWMVTAMVYQDEFAALTEARQAEDRSERELMESMLRLMMVSPSLASVIKAAVQEHNWSALAICMAELHEDVSRDGSDY